MRQYHDKQHGPCLQWVIVDEEPHHVSDFEDLLPEQRPKAYCPVCHRPVTMKLGDERIHHVAHCQGDVCIATKPESALHLNVKYHLYHQLQTASEIILLERCRERYCGATREITWLRDWDNVEVEYGFDPYRLDVALLRNNNVIGAIEVFVTHEVDEQKATYLHEQGITWLEVEGREELYQGEQMWTPNEPLPTCRRQPENTWKCEDCIRKEEEAERRKAARQLEEKRRMEEARRREEKRKREAEYKKHNYVDTVVIKIVDFFYPGDKKYRELFRIKKQVKNGQEVKRWLEQDERKVLAEVAGPITKESMDKLRQALHEYLKKKSWGKTIVDIPMNWQQWSPHLHSKMVFDSFWFPRRYIWEDGKWTLPPENEDLRWDGFWDNYEKYRIARKLGKFHRGTASVHKPHVKPPILETKTGVWMLTAEENYKNAKTGEIREYSSLQKESNN